MEILEVSWFFPRMITEQMNEELTKEISEEEIRYTLHSFQKEKIPGIDDFTLEFYLVFYDMMKNDILEVVRDIRGNFNSK